MIGTDIVKIERLADSARSLHFLERVFTENELAYWRKKGEKAETLAGFFAAKEAVSKALGTGIMRGFTFSDIEITHAESGAPIVLLHNGALISANGKVVSVSIAHDGEYAVATAILN